MIEVLSNLFTKFDRRTVNKDTVFRVLLERERIGSTCVGNGVALPHGRLSDWTGAIGDIVRMKSPIRLDAMDDIPVSLACGLLVPQNCADVHINVLASLARGFQEGDLCHRMLAAESARQLYAEIVEYDNELNDMKMA